MEGSGSGAGSRSVQIIKDRDPDPGVLKITDPMDPALAASALGLPQSPPLQTVSARPGVASE